MSPKYELLGKYDVKERSFSKVEIRNCVNSMYSQCESLCVSMESQLDCADLFGEYFEQFEVEWNSLLSIIGFLHEVHVIDPGVHDGILYRMDEMLQKVIGLFKKVYCKDE